MYAEKFAWDKLSLDVAFAEDDGITRNSLDIFERIRERIGEVTRVYLLYPPEKEPWGFYVILGDSRYQAWIFSGFSWGYSGEGPRGLARLFERIGWHYNAEGLPNPHKAGVWSVSQDGFATPLKEWQCDTCGFVAHDPYVGSDPIEWCPKCDSGVFEPKS